MNHKGMGGLVEPMRGREPVVSGARGDVLPPVGEANFVAVGKPPAAPHLGGESGCRCPVELVLVKGTVDGVGCIAVVVGDVGEARPVEQCYRGEAYLPPACPAGQLYFGTHCEVQPGKVGAAFAGVAEGWVVAYVEQVVDSRSRPKRPTIDCSNSTQGLKRDR